MSKAVRSLLIKVGAIATLMFIGLTLAPSAQAENTLDKIHRTGVFLAGVRYDFPPVGTVDDAGKPTGFGPALAKSFADKLGVKVQYVQVTSKSRIPLLLNGSIDADIGPTTPTVERNKVVDFTIPYVWDGDSLIVYKGASLNITDYAPPQEDRDHARQPVCQFSQRACSKCRACALPGIPRYPGSARQSQS